MRKLVSIFIVLALVVTTSFPSMSHARMTHDGVNIANSVTEKADCHKNEQAENGKESSGQCCDKGMCKCVGGTCHSGLSNILNNGDDLAVTSSASINGFALTDDYIESSFYSRLKRPPKA